MSAMQRRKGGRIEREIVALHKAAGIHAERVPLSGAAGGSFSGDVNVSAFGKDAAPLVTEVKARANGEGFATLARWLGENDAIFLRQNNAQPLVCLPWRTWLRLLARHAPLTAAEQTADSFASYDEALRAVRNRGDR